MKKEWLLASLLVILTLSASLAILRWMAPQLIGLPPDLRMVGVADEMPPFFEHVFNWEAFTSENFVIPDPYVKRAVPLHPDFGAIGPNDLLGFRNRHIPGIADIVTIGDSQTYGNNAPIELNWPGHLASLIEEPTEIYNMSVGAWGAVEYLEIFLKSRHLQPRVAVIAFYTGNDPLDSFRMAYSRERWAFLRPDPDLNAGDMPAVRFPAPESEQWPVRFPDGVGTVFTPNLRYGSNREHPAVDAGYAIMAKAAETIAEAAAQDGIQVIYTIIPTKELVYAKKVRESGIESTEEYERLVRSEAGRIRMLADKLRHMPGAKYVDVVAPLQETALSTQQIYPLDTDGHPLAEGYRVLAEALVEPAAASLPPPVPEGLVAIPLGEDRFEILLIRNGKRWQFAAPALIQENGWDIELAQRVTRRGLARLHWGGLIREVRREQFGPRPNR